MGITTKKGFNRSLFNILRSRLSEDLSNISETKVEERQSGQKESKKVRFPPDIDQFKDEDEHQHEKEFRKVTIFLQVFNIRNVMLSVISSYMNIFKMVLVLLSVIEILMFTKVTLKW